MKIITKNGKNRIVKESDIRRIEVDITSLWAGFIDRGKTVVHLVVEDTGDGLKPIEADISYTDAIVNIEDPKFWFAVASVVLL